MALMVEANGQDLEARRARRLRTLKGARAVSKDHRSTWDCVVRDLSPGGARLKIANPAVLPESFDLQLTDENLLIPCVVVWRKSFEVGVRFGS